MRKSKIRTLLKAPHNIVRFNFADNSFHKQAHVDQLAVHFHLTGNLIHKESEEAKYQHTGVKSESHGMNLNEKIKLDMCKISNANLMAIMWLG